jgi:hypothetical protein
MDTLVLQPNSLSGMELSFDKKIAEIPYPNVEQYQVLIPQNNLQFRQDSLYTGFLPQLVIGVLCRTQALIGHLKYDPACFAHYNLKKLRLTVDKDLLFSHQLEIECDFSKQEGYSEAFYRLVKEIEGSPASEFLTPERFAKNAAIFLFRLTPERQIDVDFDFPQPTATIGVVGEFASPVPDNLTLLLFMIRNQRV